MKPETIGKSVSVSAAVASVSAASIGRSVYLIRKRLIWQITEFQ